MRRLLLFLCSFLFCTLVTLASGKLIVSTGETLVLRGNSDLSRAVYTWTLTRNTEVITTQTASQFTHQFTQEGVYNVNLTVESQDTGKTETSKVEVLVGRGSTFTDSLQIRPVVFPLAENGIISLSPSQRSVTIILNESAGAIAQYAIDTDMSVDSDGDLDPANDIDNRSHLSFNTGAPFSFNISGFPQRIKAWVSDESGNIDEQVFVIDSGEDVSKKPLKAVLSTSPETLSDKTIRLTGDSDTVYIYAGNSEGSIAEYWIDTDITTDSNGDGDPANDVDNKEHASFATGSVFPVKVQRTEGDRVVQLTIVSTPNAQGKRTGSRLQRHLRWGNPDANIENTFRLVADTVEIYAGQAIHFAISGVQKGAGYEVKWDFNGDKSTDYTSDDSLATHIYDVPGNYTALVQIKHEEERVLKYQTIDISVLENPALPTEQRSIDFSYEQKDNIFLFTPIFPDTLEYVSFDWRFGDGIRSSQQSPYHTYLQTGSYTIRLIATTDTGISTVTEKEVVVESVPYGVSDVSTVFPQEGTGEDVTSPDSNTSTDVDTSQKPPVKTPTETGDGSEDLSAGMGVFHMLLLIATVSIIVIIVGIIGYVLYLKIKNPDYTLGEILEEEKERFLTYLEERELHKAQQSKIQEISSKVKDSVSTKMSPSSSAAHDSNSVTEASLAATLESTTDQDVLDTSSFDESRVQDSLPEESDIAAPAKKVSSLENMPPPPPPPREGEATTEEDEDLPEWLQ